MTVDRTLFFCCFPLFFGSSSFFSTQCCNTPPVSFSPLKRKLFLSLWYNEDYDAQRDNIYYWPRLPVMKMMVMTMIITHALLWGSVLSMQRNDMQLTVQELATAWRVSSRGRPDCVHAEKDMRLMLVVWLHIRLTVVSDAASQSLQFYFKIRQRFSRNFESGLNTGATQEQNNLSRLCRHWATNGGSFFNQCQVKFE